MYVIFQYYTDILEISKRLDEQIYEGISFFGNCYLNRNALGIFDPGDLYLLPSDPKIIKVPRLSRTDVWTKFEGGRPRHSRVIDQKQKCYRRADGQTDLPSNMCKLHSYFGHWKRRYACNNLQYYTAIRTLDM